VDHPFLSTSCLHNLHCLQLLPFLVLFLNGLFELRRSASLLFNYPHRLSYPTCSFLNNRFTIGPFFLVLSY